MRDSLFPRRLAATLVLSTCSLPATAQDMEMELEPFRSAMSSGYEPLGAEDPHAEDDTPRIPEPMVFDLVRPLGARQGEFEVNTLAIFNTRRITSPDPGDPLGLVRSARTEWAPEAELALFDNFAVEFELPMDDSSVAAYKTAAQLTFGTALNNSYIHGCQVMFEQLVDPSISELSMLYLAGMQFDEYWSALAMFGFRSYMGDNVDHDDRGETLFNLSIFRHVTDVTTVGVETNQASSMRGESSLLVMPQVQCEITDHIMIQSGFGVRFLSDETVPAAGVRGIYTF